MNLAAAQGHLVKPKGVLVDVAVFLVIVAVLTSIGLDAIGTQQGLMVTNTGVMP